jgi:tetratricopeptide (TPR) repeat protein
MRSTDPPSAASAPVIAELLTLAARHEQEGRLDEAAALLDGILAETPDEPDALHQKGIIAVSRGDIAEAAQLMERSIALRPESAVFHRNLCEVYRLQGHYQEALGAGERAVVLDPADPHSHHNLGVLHYDRLEPAAAIAAAERALALDPDFAGAHFGIAEAALLLGDFARGWVEYEWRLRLPGVPPLLPPSDRPRWDGVPLGPGERLLLIADQGYGDAIQFARYIPWAAARCHDLAVASSVELDPVVAQLPGVGHIFNHWDAAPDFAAHCPLSSLPRLAGTRLDSVPAPIPYLRPDEANFARWAERLWTLLPRGYRRIGIVWAGRPTHRNDRRRSAGLAALAPLAEVPGVALVALQKGPAQSELGTFWGRAPLLNLGPEIRDFGDTMAIIGCLERIVTVDTAVAHLAGAMGKPVSILLPYVPDWRWLMERDDTPWYPSARLFRQGADRRWEPVVAAVIADLVVPPARTATGTTALATALVRPATSFPAPEDDDHAVA